MFNITTPFLPTFQLCLNRAAALEKWGVRHPLEAAIKFEL